MPKKYSEWNEWAIWDDWIKKIQEDGVNLTPWEEEFVEDLRVKRLSYYKLSEKQIHILEQIYANRTP